MITANEKNKTTSDEFQTLYDKKFDEVHAEQYNQVKIALKKKKMYVRYSVRKEDSNGLPINNLNEIAVKGKIRLVQKCDKNCNWWGGPTAEDYRSKILIDPTWLDICVCANKMIQVVNDYHHAFLEGIDEESKEKDVTLYSFSMGS